MTTRVTYGSDESCELALGDHTLLSPSNSDAAGANGNPAQAVRRALAAPLDYPPLASAVVPGDRAAIALGRGVLHVVEVLQGAIESLLAAGIEAADLTVVSAEPLEDAVQRAAAGGAEGVQFEVHNPNDENAVAMVGLNSAHEPLRLNRTLADADFVLPIAMARFSGPDGAPAAFGGLFPRFSNRETADRFHGAGKVAPAQRRLDRIAEAHEAAWLLGVGMVVVVVPGPGGAVAAVVAGAPATAAHAGGELLQRIWDRSTPRPGDLVIAALAGDDSEQTWSNFARAVTAAEKVLAPEGAIAVCCELEEPPGGAFDKLVDAVDFSAVAQRLRRDAAEDARPARILAQALERGPVYLLSRLPAEVVESLGMTPIESESELSRLASGRRHCVVIEEAQRVRPRLTAQAERS